MKRIFQTLSIVVLMMAASAAHAVVDNLSVSVAVTIRTLSIVWTTGGDTATRDWTFNAVLSGTYDSNTHGKSSGGTVLVSTTPTRFDLTNSSGAPVDIATTVPSQGANWTIGAAIADNVYTLKNSINNGVGWSAVMVATATQIQAALADATSLPFDLQMRVPSAVSNGAANTITVTMTATISP